MGNYDAVIVQFKFRGLTYKVHAYPEQGEVRVTATVPLGSQVGSPVVHTVPNATVEVEAG